MQKPACKEKMGRMKNSRGATLLLSLLFFILCAVVGSVILTAATAASGRLSGLAQQEEDYYTVTSAAEYLASLLEGTQVVIRNSGTQEDPLPTVTDADGDALSAENAGLNLLLKRESFNSSDQQNLEDLYSLYVSNGGTLSGSQDTDPKTPLYFLLDPQKGADSTTASSGHPAVVSYLLKKDFSVVFDVYPAVESGSGGNQYTRGSWHIRVTVPARVDRNMGEDREDRYQIYWDQADISRVS
jgi:hypothetical protein